MPLEPLKLTAPAAGVGVGRDPALLLSPSEYDADAVSIRSDQDTDSEDDERQLRARNSRELLAHDRLVLMEEEELDQLVIEARREQARERRGSGLPIPNPLRLLTRRLSDASTVRNRSRSPSAQPPAPSIHDSAEDLRLEKRRARRARRKAKRDRLFADARHGEDGELMYEMEEGGMKEGSETGSSSDREDSDELDRRNLLHRADLKARRSCRCRAWALVYAIIGVAFSILVLVAWKLSTGTKSSRLSQNLVSNGTALFAPTTILISLDGFRADFLQRGLTPNLDALVKSGVSPPYMLPSFPSVTFPNHHTIATGLYPESHGIVGNTFWDPVLQAEFYYTDPARSRDPKWWKGEPFWVTAQKQGLKTAIHMWQGSQSHIQGVEPTYVDPYNGRMDLLAKADRILEFLDKPDPDRPQIVAAYVPNVDSDGHKYGPNSTEIRSTLRKVDKMFERLLFGLDQRNLTNIVNIIVVSDHGMATTDVSRLIQLEDIVDLSKFDHIDGWPLIGLRPKNPNELQAIYNQVIQKTKDNPNLDVYLRDVNMPERYHFSHNERIAPLWIIPKAGWALVKMDEMNVKEAQAKGETYHPRGLHGYDHEHPLMRAIFIARGPAFPHPPNSRLNPFQNIEVYNLLCDSVGIVPAPNNGTLRLPLRPVGLHSDPDAAKPETPSDPPATTRSASNSPPSVSPTHVPTTTKTILVNPVVSDSPQSLTHPITTIKSVGVDPPIPEPTSSQPQEGGETNSSGDGKSFVNKVESSVKDFWDWFTGKVSSWWDKVTGPADQGRSNSSGAEPSQDGKSRE